MGFTQHELAFGKINQKIFGADKIELYREHNIYHVRRFSKSICGKLVQESWLSFERLNEAKKAFQRQCDIAKSINK